MHFYLIAGEASGDLHGANLIKAIKAIYPYARFTAWGGDKMKAAGAELVSHYHERNFMGFVEVIRHLPLILGYMKKCKQDLLAKRPDAIIFIDYPGFNLPIAEFAKKNGFKTIWYISPQVWAWKESRVKKIKRYVDLMLVILPFETEFYKKWNYPARFVGHPLLDEIAQQTDIGTLPKFNKPVIALLPGSRPQEVRLMLPEMLKASRNFSDYQFVLAAAPSLPDSLIEEFTGEYPNVAVIKGKTYEVLKMSEAALVTSGTATLETGLFKVPMVVCYKGNYLSYLIARRLIKIKYISLVNLILDRPLVKELIQDEMNAEAITAELEKILPGGQNADDIRTGLEYLHQQLGGAGASERATDEIYKFLTL